MKELRSTYWNVKAMHQNYYEVYGLCALQIPALKNKSAANRL